MNTILAANTPQIRFESDRQEIAKSLVFEHRTFLSVIGARDFLAYVKDMGFKGYIETVRGEGSKVTYWKI